MSLSNHTQTIAVPIPLFFGLMNPWERYITPHMGNDIKVSFEFQNIYVNNQSTIIGENKKHMYDNLNPVSYELKNTLLSYNTGTSNEDDLKQFVKNMDTISHIEFVSDAQLKIKEIDEDENTCNELSSKLKSCVIKFKDITLSIFKSIKNDKKSADDDITIRKILEGYEVNIDKPLIKKVYERINNFVQSHNTLNFKKNDDFGKHNNTMFNNNFPMSSTVIKRQQHDNHKLADYIINLFPSDEGDIYKNILINIQTYAHDDKMLEKNRIIEIFCSNIVVFSLIKEIEIYSAHIKSSKNRILSYPHMILNKEVAGFSKTFGKIVKCTTDDLNNIKWNKSSDRQIFNEIFMLNTYDSYWGHLCENNKMYKCMGFAICKSNSNNKYNIFPTVDSRIDFRHIGKTELNNSETKYLLGQ